MQAYNPAPALSAVPEVVQLPVRIPGVKPLGWYLASARLSFVSLRAAFIAAISSLLNL